jgi:hypothetical protein
MWSTHSERKKNQNNEASEWKGKALGYWEYEISSFSSFAGIYYMYFLTGCVDVLSLTQAWETLA